MEEYIELGHMTNISKKDQMKENGKVYYIPYISIVRKYAITTKLRNVFNASAKTSNDVFLNDTIHPGPKLQTHIFDILTRIRQFKFIYSSDVTKMYRQILIKPEDRDKLRILWRPNRQQDINEYQLNTITYGLDCSPWQAIRTLHQVADDNDKKISAIINLDKIDTTIKTLGLLYNPMEDTFAFKVKDCIKIKYTKRGLLSIEASLYDPLGWLMPTVIHFTWVSSQKELQNKFVNRRVQKIKKILKPYEINYVKSIENPADPASRGLTPEQLVKCELWFQGPYWLKEENLP